MRDGRAHGVAPACGRAANFRTWRTCAQLRFRTVLGLMLRPSSPDRLGGGVCLSVCGSYRADDVQKCGSFAPSFTSQRRRFLDGSVFEHFAHLTANPLACLVLRKIAYTLTRRRLHGRVVMLSVHLRSRLLQHRRADHCVSRGISARLRSTDAGPAARRHSEISLRSQPCRRTLLFTEVLRARSMMQMACAHPR